MFTLQQSKDYLLHRLSAEQSSSKHLQDELTHFALRLQRLLKRFYVTDPLSPQALQNRSLQEEIHRLMTDFIDTLIENTELLSDACNQDRKDAILAFIHSPRNGLTFTSRLSHWTTLYVSYLFDHWSKSGTTTTPTPNLKSGAAYGLDRLTRQTIALAWMENLGSVNKDAKSFICHRGSSYGCPHCDEMCEIERPLTDYSQFAPPFHPNCCCWVEFKA